MTYQKLIRWLWWAAIGFIALSILYWGLFAANRYVSESHVVVESLQTPPATTFDLTSVLGGTTQSKDILLLQDYLLSADMLRRLDEKLKLRDHYSGSYDLLSRMLRRDASFEWFLRHYQDRVEAEYDEYTGILTIRAQAYTQDMAYAIGRALVEEGERFMNELAHRLAREQVAYAEREVVAVSERVSQSRQTLLAFQNKHGLVSPTGTVESLSAVTSRLEGELTGLQAKRRSLESYLTSTAPDLVQINNQVRAVEQQLAAERARLASPNGKGTLNRVAEEYDRLLLESYFHQDVYRTALAALERARIDANRTLKKLSIIQAPTLPDSSTEPARLYMIVAFLLGTLILTGILQLLVDIVREHRD